MNLLNDIDLEFSNIPNSIINKLNKNLYLIDSHPLEIIKTKIFEYFKKHNDFNIY